MTAFLILDVFTGTPLAGNPLAVVPDARALPEERLQPLAREFNLSETAFVFPPDHAANDARLRIFTPTQELGFAGHPSVGTALALARAGHVLGRPAGDRLRLEEGAGLVLADIIRTDGEVTGAAIRAPAAFAPGPERPVAQVAALAGLAAQALLKRSHAPTYASVGTGFLLAETTAAALADAVPDTHAFAAERSFAPPGHLPALLLWADLGHKGDELMVEARMFAPLSGVAEDPATGSAAAALGALLASLDVTRRLRVAQGHHMGRPSTIDVEVRADGVWIAGNAVAVMAGRLL